VRATTSYGPHRPRSSCLGDLILCEPPSRSEVVPSLRALFRTVIGDVPSFKFLPPDQLAEVLGSEGRGDLFVGGSLDLGNGILTLARGDLRPINVPLEHFPSANDARPDFKEFGLDDFGYAIRFGDYEASAHSVLYKLDADYRRRINKKRTEEESGFGASLRRLRLLRGLNQDQFPGVSARTIARIEKGTIGKPQHKTLAKIAAALEVATAEIEEY
jgi:DNA-binding XRE family transcriptional regulator